jgi:predicted CXXCH cytochrome family protein
MELAAHKEPGECLACHNPHLGKNKKMLKKDYQEVENRLRLSPDLPGPKAPPGGLPKRGSSSQE